MKYGERRGPMMYSKQTSWKTHLGNYVTIEGMEDEHLANSIQFATYYGNKDILKELKRESKHRKLTKAFLDRAPFPYKDGRGNWIIWDFKVDGPKVIGSYLRG